MTDTTPEPIEAQSTEPAEVTEAAEAAETALEEQPDERHQAKVIYSLIDDGLGNDMLVGWDTCGKCFFHIRQCTCIDGPHRPVYIERFAFRPVPERKVYNDGGDMVTGTMHASADRETVETVETDIAVESPKVDTEPQLTPSGRRKRKDAGQKRGPRNPEATKAAAEELSQAIKEQHG